MLEGGEALILWAVMWRLLAILTRQLIVYHTCYGRTDSRSLFSSSISCSIWRLALSRSWMRTCSGCICSSAPALSSSMICGCCVREVRGKPLGFEGTAYFEDSEQAKHNDQRPDLFHHTSQHDIDEEARRDDSGVQTMIPR